MKFTKQEIEKAIAKKFISLYNWYFKTSYKVKNNWEQWKINEPDIICSEDLNIEIVSNHYSNNDTANIANQIKTAWIAISLPMEWPDDSAFKFILQQIKTKEIKLTEWKYQYKWKIFLIIDIRHTPITTTTDYKNYFNKNIIKKSKFNEIWLFNHRDLISSPLQNIHGIETVNWWIHNKEYVIYNIY